MFNRREHQQSSSAKTDRGPVGFLKGKLQAGKQPSLPPMEWHLGSAVSRVIEVELSPDNQEFLMMAHAADSPGGLSEFINSLLWQERFRQGYPMRGPSQTPASVVAFEPKPGIPTLGWFGRDRHPEV